MMEAVDQNIGENQYEEFDELDREAQVRKYRPILQHEINPSFTKFKEEDEMELCRVTDHTLFMKKILSCDYDLRIIVGIENEG